MSGDIKRLTYNVKETAEALGVTEDVVLELIESKKLPTLRIEDEVLVPVGKLKTWINNNSVR